MRLSKDHIDKITTLILKNLKEKELAVLKAAEGNILEKIIEVITNNLREEDELDREVEKILEAHSSEMKSQGVDYRKMFNMVKNKLARERKFVL